MAGKSGEERLKEMEAEMALFEQEVLGGSVSGSPPLIEPIPVALAVPMVRPIIGTNTYRQVQQTLEARAASFGPPPAFVGPVPPVRPPPPPIMRPAFVPHILQRPGGQRLPVMRGPPVAPPLPRPPPPPPMMVPPSLPQGGAAPIQHLSAAPRVGEMVAVPMVPTPPRPGNPSLVKPTPSIIQAAPTVYTAPPAAVVQRKADVQAQRQARMEELAARVAKQQAAVMAAGLLDRKDSEESSSVIGPSMPEPEVPHTEVMPVESVSEDKKKGKNEKVKKCIRIAAGSTWEDPSLLEWESDDFRIFCGDLGNEVNDDILARAFSRYPSFLKAKVVRDKRTGKTKGYGFVSFKDPNDYVRAMREMNGKYVGSRPIKLRKSMWKDRNIEVVRKKQKEKKKLGLR
ncbi:PREDICTED: RNA-binding protein 42 isoform X1 [Poecilia mexicana]|uniref:RNA-binding protein 42 n=1 Tax=Poecilia mexicana TaxID=48701 RepID=A0A3B3X0Y5_9TELE|nr:PREDICTED: RNA-binding protein 42 isoform X1 [Poecilia mexicana]XP_014832430.1 PREDICTED: RNA-binding protein 42 isoform X1 [Poecilia mexicana]XP_014832431.1 PREDICTED: RNA-binding protein 42 isoform X1 [Poecilia mexicana]XP_014832432.1 PREDICTED: RNA-binding protein 42 isoform X1 [Poecilia mexicana]